MPINERLFKYMIAIATRCVKFNKPLAYPSWLSQRVKESKLMSGLEE